MIKYSKLLRLVDKFEAWLFARANKQISANIDKASVKLAWKKDAAQRMKDAAEEMQAQALTDFNKTIDELSVETAEVLQYRRDRNV